MHAWAKEVLNLKNSSRTTEIVWGCYKSSWPNYQMSYDGHEKELPRTIFFSKKKQTIFSLFLNLLRHFFSNDTTASKIIWLVRNRPIIQY